MHPIERYGVIVLLFLLVVILVVSLWDSGGRETGKEALAAVREESTALERPIEVPGPRPAPARVRRDQDVPLSGRGGFRVTADASAPPTSPGPAPERSLAPIPVRLPAPESSEAPIATGPSEERTAAAPPLELARAATARPAGPAATEREASATPAQRGSGAAAEAAVYFVRSGDTLGAIAERALGSASRWREIHSLNPGIDPTRLHVGAKLNLPAGAGPIAASAPRPVSPTGGGRWYVIRSGDVLSRIAERELGSSQRWTDIVALNEGLDPGRLLVGARIRLPGASSRADAAPGVEAVAAASPEPTKFKVR